MAVKRYWALKDNTITNAYESNLQYRATGSNMGGSDVLEVFSVYQQAGTSSSDQDEFARILIQFPITGSNLQNDYTSVKRDRVLGNIPASGSVEFYLKMYNARHSLTTPRDYSLVVAALNKDWDEGSGLDMDNYTDVLYGDMKGSNWISSSLGTKWTSAGGDWDNDDSLGVTASFYTGVEDMEVNVTPLVENWIAGTKNNYGVIVRLAPDLESAEKSYYTKKFFGRTSEFFFKRPVLEARWNSATRDDRNNFYYSSSVATLSDNLNTLYYYNFVRGRLRAIPLDAGSEVVVSLYTASPDGTPSATDGKIALSKGGGVVAAGDVNATASVSSTGVYTVSLSATGSKSSHSTLYDVWQIRKATDQGVDGYTQIYTGSIKPKSDTGATWNRNRTYVTTVPNLKKTYHRTDTDRLRLYTREKDWSPTIYNKANNTIERSIIESGSYRITRNIDKLVVLPFGTGSEMHTQMSYDVSGNYFDVDFSILASGYSYTMDFSFYDDSIGDWIVQPQKFKFRVDE
tara:strand:- start:2938 stop:4482 length:1545 start_codon:yes stop_codon:yes gene_type:complete